MKNRFCINGMETIIFARQRDGREVPVIIDTADLLKVSLATNRSWCVGTVTNMKTPYCFVSQDSGTLYMHRVIMDTPAGKVVDHRNTNTIDNRKRNLENVTSRENLRRGFERRSKALEQSKLTKIQALLNEIEDIIAA